MSFLAELLSGSLQDSLIIGAARKRNKTFLIGFGILTSIVSIGIVSIGLLLYFYSLPTVTVNTYYTTEISYSEANYYEDYRTKEIRLISGPNQYRIYDRFWTGHFIQAKIVPQLCQYHHATS